jgi:hypothetical protein
MGETREIMAEIEQSLDMMIEDKLIEPRLRDTAKLCLVAGIFGCKNIDKLAFRAKLPRDRFVRPRARLMRESGIWNADGTISMETANGPPEDMNIEFVLHVLCADGQVKCTWDSREASREMLFAWRCSMLPSGVVVTPEILTESLSGESLARKDVPAMYDRAVTSFRHLRQDVRLAAAKRWFAENRPVPEPTYSAPEPVQGNPIVFDDAIKAGDLVYGKTPGYLWVVVRVAQTRARIKLVHSQPGQGAPNPWERWEKLSVLKRRDAPTSPSPILEKWLVDEVVPGPTGIKD